MSARARAWGRFRRYAWRCWSSGARRTRRRLPQADRCACGAWWAVDWYRTTGAERRRFRPCRCDAYHFPHRRSGGWCDRQPLRVAS